MLLKTPGRLALLCLFFFVGQSAIAQINSRASMERASYYNWLMYQKTKAEGGNLLKWWHGESTIGTILSGTMTYTHRNKYDSMDNRWGRSYDSVISGPAKALTGYHVNSNVNYMLARLGTSSILSFSYGLQLDVQRWKFNSFDGFSLKTTERLLWRGQIGLPLTVEYKSGCDVDFDPNIKSCFAVGAGAMPMVYGSYYDNIQEDGGFRVAPYAYASFGFYAWGCWKIRAAIIPGKCKLFDNMQGKGGGVTTTFSATTSNMFMIGISHMTWSRDWPEGRGTRGRHGGFGGRRRHVRSTGRMF